MDVNSISFVNPLKRQVSPSVLEFHANPLACHDLGAYHFGIIAIGVHSPGRGELSDIG